MQKSLYKFAQICTDKQILREAVKKQQTHQQKMDTLQDLSAVYGPNARNMKWKLSN